jgi:hypothetical protein
MNSRESIDLEKTVKRGILMSITKGVKSAIGMMMKGGVPTNVIIRVLFQQDKIRPADLAQIANKKTIRPEIIDRV